MTATEFAQLTTVPPDRLGRCTNVEQVVARHGRAAVQPVIDGYLTADDLALEVLADFADLPGATGRRMFWAGPQVADELGVPDTWHKHLPHLAKPVMAAMETARRLGRLDDEKLCRSTLALLAASAAPEGDETTIATPDDIVANVEANAPTFAAGRGRHHQAGSSR